MADDPCIWLDSFYCNIPSPIPLAFEIEQQVLDKKKSKDRHLYCSRTQALQQSVSLDQVMAPENRSAGVRDGWHRPQKKAEPMHSALPSVWLGIIL
jgi:hypothetical protein